MSPRRLLFRLRWRQADQVFECRTWCSSAERRVTSNGQKPSFRIADSGRSIMRKRTLEINVTTKPEHVLRAIGLSGWLGAQ